MATDQSLMSIALAAHDAGMSIIPIRNDGKKKPAVAWKQYQVEAAPKEQVRAWFAPGQYKAAAVVCGKVSGWLVMIEMEGWAFAQGLWRDVFRPAVVERLGEERWGEITEYVEESPSGGIHIYVRCPGYEIGNVKLAMRDGVVAMETRGEGGYSIIARSEGHPTGNPWSIPEGITGTLANVATVTHAELDAILDAARTLHEEPASTLVSEGVGAVRVTGETAATADAAAPTPSLSSDRWMDETIEDFNATTDVLTWLRGWEYRETDTYNGETVHRLHRIGSDNDHGAVVFESGRVAFFSSNCPHWAKPYDGYGTPETYDPFTVMMWEEKGTNDVPARVAIALDLRAQGFGPPLVSSSDETPVAPDTEEPEAPAGMIVRWVDEAIANPPPEPEVIVTGLLRRGEVTVLGAPRAIGKTWASLNLANICARGEGQLFGSALYTAVTPARVLYLQGELGEWGSASRWAALPHETPDGMVAETFQRIRIRTTQRSVTTVEDGTTYHDTHTDAVVDWRLEPAIADLGVDVLIIDPWATFFAGNENNNDETEAAITALIDIARRRDIAIFIVHHISNKTDRGSSAEPEDLWRGASRLADAVSTRMTVLPYYTAKQASEAGMTRMEARKHVKVTTLERNGPSPEMIYAKREAFWWNAWTPPETGRPEEVTVRDLVRVLRDQPGMTVPSKRRLGAILDKSHSAIDRVVEQAIAQGLVEETAGARGAVGLRLVADL